MIENTDHPSHEWRYSDSSIYDFVCRNCNCVEETKTAKEPCIANKVLDSE